MQTLNIDSIYIASINAKFQFIGEIMSKQRRSADQAHLKQHLLRPWKSNIFQGLFVLSDIQLAPEFFRL